MICPNCSANVPDDSLRCPACRADLGRTVVIPKLEGRWCKSCGSLIPDDADTCPSCAFPAPKPAGHEIVRHPQALAIEGDDPDDATLQGERDPESPEDEESHSTEETHAIVRIESAIPSAPVPGNPRVDREHALRLRTLAFALVAALVFVGGGVLLITHPWDPSANDPRARAEADTSRAGFPGIVSELKGQDNRINISTDIRSGDDTTLAKLQDVYIKLGDLKKEVDKNEELYRSVAASGDESARERGKEEAIQLSLDISNLIQSIADIDVTSGTYASDAQNMSTLGNYLRNRMDALTRTWKRALRVSSPESHSGEILGYLTDSGQGSWKNQFEQSYPTMSPQKK